MCKTMTKSEEDTVRFFRSIGIEIQKVSECSEKTPDYHLSPKGCSIYLEVKEIDENDEEKEIRRKVDEFGESGVYDTSPVGKRFRSKIAESNRQLKKLCVNKEPGIVLIQDVRPFVTKSLMPQEELKQAMFGDRVTWRNVPLHQNNNSSAVTADIYSRNKTTTESKNTTVSAVALLIEHSQTGELTMLLHHNPHAKNPLPESIFSGDRVKEFKVNSTKNYGGFVEV